MHNLTIATKVFVAIFLCSSSATFASNGGKNSTPVPNDGLVMGNVQAVLEADGHGLRGKPWAEQQALQTLTGIHGIDFIPAPVFELALQDNQFYLMEDDIVRETEDRKPLRFAIPVSVELDIANGDWIPVEGGRLWRVVLMSPNATTARLHLTGLDVPEGQEVRISSPGWVDSVIGPINGIGEFGTGEAWSMAMPTNQAMIEWFVPTGTKVATLPFANIDYYHGYREIWKLGEEGEGGVAVGSCHLDPICFPTWSNESNATLRLIFSGSLCSGQLTATTALDETPYVTTANHCISTASVANSCQFNFFYRRNTCSSSAATSAGVNITGSDMPATYASSDCTLLLIRPTLPTDSGWAGWIGATQPTNTASTGLHHPDGSYQRISFGTKNATSFNCGSPSGNWSSLSWNSATQYGVTSTGVTEGGSSGSAIYRNSDRKLYGVLTCGGSICSSPQLDDGYGRLDLAISNGGFATLLASGTDDTLEPNNTCASPRTLIAGTYSALVVKRLAEDWYAITVGAGATLTGTFTYTHANGDIDLELYSSCGTTPVLIRNGNVNNETLSYVNPGATAVFYLRVFLASDTRNEYSMVISVPITGPSNDNCATPTAIGNGGIAFNTATATNSTPALPASCNEGAGIAINNDLWYAYTPSCTGTATASTCGAATFDTRIAVYSSCSSAVIACSDNASACAGNTSKVSWPVTAGSVSYVRIGSTTTTTGTGTLTLSCALACVADLNGDIFVDGADLAVLLGAWATSGADLNGDAYTDGADLAIMLGSFGSCP